MASVRLLKGIHHACRFSPSRLKNIVRHMPQMRFLASGPSSALPPLEEMPESELAEYEVSTEEFKYVERILPPATIPYPPEHATYPTPSGWSPPKESAKSLPYFVKRTKNHMFPIYEEFRNGNTRKLVVIRNIDGDIWAFDADLKAYLKELTGLQVIASQVHEPGGYIRVKGRHSESISQFLLDKGF